MIPVAWRADDIRPYVENAINACGPPSSFPPRGKQTEEGEHVKQLSPQGNVRGEAVNVPFP